MSPSVVFCTVGSTFKGNRRLRYGYRTIVSHTGAVRFFECLGVPNAFPDMQLLRRSISLEAGHLSPISRATTWNGILRWLLKATVYSYMTWNLFCPMTKLLLSRVLPQPATLLHKRRHSGHPSQNTSPASFMGKWNVHQNINQDLDPLVFLSAYQCLNALVYFCLYFTNTRPRSPW